MEEQNQLDRIEGRNPVVEALRKGRNIDKLFIQKDITDGSMGKIRAMAREKGVIVSEVAKQKLDHMSQTGAHQGVIACTAVHEYVDVDDILKIAEEKGESPFLVIADEISDPHNLGSILRTANAAGVHGVIIPKHRSVGLSAVVAKSSAGAIEYVPVARVTNLARTVDDLKKQGIWVAGAAMEGTQTYYQVDYTGALAIVVGSEGFGISRLLKEKCDFLVSIPMKGEINSLNASVAAGVLLMEASRQRG
ncbi:MAG: 23S rRNA (guanosine(2251)-2'-O)-methyltransferase RlmB [Ruminococcaceae bacterium]|nr:23S rRNA (guanosine(2251)-2'-O)-methyltransferase RlmB [Oscillospiraceae bacterium]